MAKTPPEVHKVFRAIGKIGGNRVRDLIEKGKLYEQEHPEAQQPSEEEWTPKGRGYVEQDEAPRPRRRPSKAA